MNRQLLLRNGPILTMDRESPVVDAVLCQFGRVIAVGSLKDVQPYIAGPIDDIDLEGRLATPGINDAHAHPDGIGLMLDWIGLAAPAVTSISQIRHLVRDRVQQTQPGQWIVGHGYDQATLLEGRHPTRYDLDDIAPHNPVILWRACHHIAVANSLALELAGITADTPDVSDGTLDRDEHGEPTGVARETMASRIAKSQPDPTEEEFVSILRRGGEECRRFGITSMTDALVNRAIHLRAYQRLRASGELPLRITTMMMIDETLDELIELGIVTGFGDDWLRIGPAKLFADGSIGGRTARLRAPYLDEPQNCGLWVTPPERIREQVLRAHRAGFQIGIHAIGDAAIEAVLDAYAAAQSQYPRPDPRHRIEHCSLADLAQIQRIQRLGVVPVPGTTFLYSSLPMYLKNLGSERIRYAYGMKTFAEHRIVAAASSDAPIESANPLYGIQTMVTRTDRIGNIASPEERIPLEDALRAYTVNAAYATHSEHRKGLLRPGYLADITVFDVDLRTVAKNELANQRVAWTILDGEVVYQGA